ncbi:hypothetical protein M2281_002802 [Mesorhizobium soli]|nr:hypothetical protein [Mesorhizobium soli]
MGLDVTSSPPWPQAPDSHFAIQRHDLNIFSHLGAFLKPKWEIKNREYAESVAVPPTRIARRVEEDPAVVQYLVRRIERSLSTAIGVVDRLDGTALEQKTRITRALAAEVLNALDEGQAEFDL